jgi:hypothetical protein
MASDLRETSFRDFFTTATGGFEPYRWAERCGGRGGARSGRPHDAGRTVGRASASELEERGSEAE